MPIPSNEKISREKILSLDEKNRILENINDLKTLTLDSDQVQEVKNIAKGVYAPLEGFLREADFNNVVSRMRLANGMLWPLPIVLDVSKEIFQEIKNERDILLIDEKKKPIALLKNIEIYPYEKKFFVNNVFGTDDKNHPGVAEIYHMGEYLIGGEIHLIDDSKGPFLEFHFDPQEVRAFFEKKGWKSIAVFQTRNIPHRGHEFLHHEALKTVDGLFIQPVIGKKKIADFKDEFIIASYQILIEQFYPKERVFFGILPYNMRYAGPREALLHALIRKNYGCTHFIVGRDHAGVGNYYPPYAAQELVEQMKQEIGIEILKFPEVVYCEGCKKHLFVNDCSHRNEKIFFSGTTIREITQNTQEPPFTLIRPHIYYFISQSDNPLIDYLYKKQKNQKGFTLWFTGLSQSGKTTIAKEVAKILNTEGIIVERLDGDVVRQSLSKDLGFSKEDRDENIRRVGDVARFFNQRGVVVIASFISPYRETRRELRNKIPKFIEVYCKCPIEVCMQRDTKGLYKKAENGEIPHFTGISDPYEEPTNAEIVLSTDRESIVDCALQVIQFLKEKRLIV